MANVALLHGFHPWALNRVVPGGWSIAVEFLFYAIFPFLYTISKRRPRALPVLAAAGFVLLLAGVWVAERLGKRGGNDAFFFYSLPCQFPCFLMGFALFRRLRSGSSSGPERLLGFAAFPCLVLVYDRPWGWLITPTLAGLGFATLGCLLVSRSIRRSLASLIGEASYSIYLLHFVIGWYFCRLFGRPLRDALGDGLGSFSAFLAVLAISTLAARVTYRLVEIPFIKVGRRVSSRLRLSPSKATSTIAVSPSVVGSR